MRHISICSRLLKASRPAILAAAAGGMLCLTPHLAQAQLPEWLGAGTNQPAPLPAPRLLPSTDAAPLAPPSPGVRLTAGEYPQQPPANNYSQQRQAAPAAQRPIAPQNPQPPQRESGNGLMSKFKSVFKNPMAGRTAPVDPGMTYPTWRENQNRQKAVVNNPPVQKPASVPGLFNAPAGANPIQQPAPLPVQQPANVAARPVVIPERRAVAEQLPEIYVPENLQPQVARSAPPAAQLPPHNEVIQPLPQPQLNAPLAAPGPQMALAAPQPVPAALPAVTPQPQVPADPFENLFPEDEPREVASQPVPPVAHPLANAAPAEVPYTGLTLNEDPFTAAAPEQEQLSAANQLSSPAGQGVIAVQLPDQVAESQGAAPPIPPLALINEAQEAAPLPKLDLVPAAGLPKLAPAANPGEHRLLNVAPAAPPVDDAEARMQLIAGRDGEGLKGFCPVALRDRRELVVADEEIAITFNGVRYAFAGEADREVFLKDPARYVPAANGTDVIHLALTGEHKSGKLDHAVWYKGQLYLFTDAETMETFIASPSAHAASK